MDVAPRDQPMTVQAIQDRIADGQLLVVYENSVLRLDSWLAMHPGGPLAIQHMIGRDATDEIKIYHSDAVLKTMKAYRVGRIPAGRPWRNLTPPIRGGVHIKAVDASGECDDSNAEAFIDEQLENSSSSDSCGDDTDSDFADQSSIATDCSDAEGVVKSTLRRRLIVSADASSAELPSSTSDKIDINRLEYTDMLIAKEAEASRSAYPSLDTETQANIVEKYRALHERVRNEGFYDCNYSAYAREIARYVAFMAASMTALQYGWYMTSAVFLGVFWHQIMFSAHDAGHCAITHHFETDTLIALFLGDFCSGLSVGWWKSSHNVHHLITNDTAGDPDTQNVPVFAVCPSFFKSLKSTYYENFIQVWDKAADVIIPYQKYTYYPIMALARFNLYFLSWLHVLSNRSGALRQGKAWWIRPTEALFMSCYWFLFGYCLIWRTLPTWPLRVAYVLVSHLVTMPLHVQITLSHWGMPTTSMDDFESFPQRQLRTTMDVDCPEWFDWYHGGLQFQAVHHLFPRVPRHNLRMLQGLVKEFCAETGIKYSIYGFVDGNKVVLSRLEEVAKQVETLIKCQDYMAETGESGLH
ncbi:fatty acid desaturase-domain-containing protein [Microdochium bolleyi]|uniref:Delta 8-(E)-sphingolipid desaturase n=1 Tax=Microdochium bolleyi TaxID=196109 RepID=A0A136II83_9PEZI|nr:fatty acid desaturase-domain-containing protein [Microdochium bolleyi]